LGKLVAESGVDNRGNRPHTPLSDLTHSPEGGQKEKRIENSKTADGRIDTEQPHKPAKLRRGKEFSGSPLRRNGGRQYRGEKESEQE